MMTYCKVTADIDRYAEAQGQRDQFEQELESRVSELVEAADAQLQAGQDITAIGKFHFSILGFLHWLDVEELSPRFGLYRLAAVAVIQEHKSASPVIRYMKSMDYISRGYEA